MFDLLWENQALHLLAFENYGVNFMNRVKEVEHKIRQQKGANKGAYPVEYYYSSVKDLVNKNR